MSGNPPNRDQFPGPGELCVLVAGKPGNGKSTALNNVFDVQLETGVTSRSVTKKIEVTKVRKNGIALTVVDTPGLGALDIKKEVVTNEIAEVLNGRPYTLLYCLSVSPDCRLTELDETIARNLQATLGEEVWDRCVLLLTFSDTARSADDFKLKPGPYKEYIKGVAVGFGSILSNIGSTDVRVCTVFDYDSNTIFNRAKSGREVMAIPVGKSVSGEGVDKMLPDVIGSDECWTDLVFVEIMRMTNESHRRSFMALKYGVQATDCGASSVVVPGTSRSSSALWDTIKRVRAVNF